MIHFLYVLLICTIAGLGAGVGTGLAGLSAAAIISPMLITFLGFSQYEAVGIALASDVLASAVSAYTYGKNKNIDIKNGTIMLCSVLVFTVIGSYLAKIVQNTNIGSTSMESVSIVMTFFLGLKFIFKPVTKTKEDMANKSRKRKIIESLIGGGMIGFICGFVGAGGGMMMLLILTSVLGYELKTAVGTSVFIMTFTALTGAISHGVSNGGMDPLCLVLCIVVTFLGAKWAAVLANRTSPKKLNRITGVVISGLALVMIFVYFVSNDGWVNLIQSFKEALVLLQSWTS